MPAVTVAKGKWGSASLAVFLLDGYNLLTGKMSSVRFKRESLTEQTDGVGDSSQASTPCGMSKVEVAQEGAFYDTTALSSHAAFAASLPTSPQAVQRLMCLGFSGNTVGQPFIGFEGSHTSAYEVLAQVGKLTRANAMHTMNGAADDGVIVHAHGAETADANTETGSVDNTTVPQRTMPITSNSIANPTVVTTPVPHLLATGDTVLIAGVATSNPTINGERTVTVISPTTFSVPVNVTVAGTGGTFTRGKTQAGGVGYLQMSALTLGGHTGALVTIRHSDDDSIFVDLVAFTTRTTTGAERVTVAGSVRRYLAQAIDFTGAGSPTSTYFAGFARG